MCGLELKTVLLPLTSGADVSMPAFNPEEDILNINWQKFAKTSLIVIN